MAWATGLQPGCPGDWSCGNLCLAPGIDHPTCPSADRLPHPTTGSGPLCKGPGLKDHPPFVSVETGVPGCRMAGLGLAQKEAVCQQVA